MKNENVVAKNTAILNLTEGLQRLSLHLVNSVRGRFQIKFGMTSLFNNSGFTLIELLVVVIIIGILAAVAVPQYKVAIVKSRLASIIPILTAIKNASEVYYLQNGEYTNAPRQLDIFACNESDSVFQCDNYFYIDLIAQGLAVNNNIRAFYCPNDLNNWTNCTIKADFVYTLWLNHSDYPNKIECTPKTNLGTRICKTLQN